MQVMEYRLIIPVHLKPSPTQDEIAVAKTLADYFQSDVEFVVRSFLHTPDLKVCRLNQYWEIKNIRGNSPKTIENILRTAQYQSDNIIISLSRTKMDSEHAVSRIKQCLRRNRVAAKRIIVISKRQKVIVVK